MKDLFTYQQAMSEKELAELGMTKAQIAGLKSYDSTSKATRSFGASLHGTADVASNITYSSGKSWVDLEYSWYWDGTPWFSRTDITAIANSENYYLSTSSSYQEIKYRYNGSYGPYSTYYKYKSVEGVDSGLGAKSKFSVIDKVEYDNMGNPMPYYCWKGTLVTKFYRAGTYDQNMGMTGSYGHNQLSASPSVSLTPDGPNVGLDFTFGITTLGENHDWLD